MTEAQTNGPSDGKFIDSIDPDDPERVKDLRRPAEVKEDITQMHTRQRVSKILNSQAFKEELEILVQDQIKAGPHPASLVALQQISDLLGTPGRYGSTSLKGSVLPIADIRGVESLNYSKGEKLLRCKVAATYRLVDLFGWASSINNHITVRIGQDQEHFLLSPYGMLHSEVTAASLLKVDMQGEVVDAGITSLGVNQASYSLHSSIHAARPDIRAVIHVQTPAAIAVSSMSCGLLPMSQQALVLGEVTTNTFTGALIDQDEKDAFARKLGPRNKVMLLRNHGIVVCGATIEEAFYFLVNAMSAIDTQLRTLPVGLDNITLIPEEERARIVDLAQQSGGDGEGKRKMRRGELEFEALMRSLDNAGYRTGYIYHEPLIKKDARRDRMNSDVEVPPSSSSFAYYYDSDNKGFESPLKHHMERQKKQQRTDWLNTPNAYTKEEIDEIGTANPKKITKWVPGGEQKSTTPIQNPNQFAPQGEDPKELREKHKLIRKDYYTERVSAGPQSKILEGATWEDAGKIRDGQMSGTSDSVIVVGAASKGIIQRDHQHNAVVYKTTYATNPFDNMNEDEIEKYKQEIEQGQREPESDLEPGPDGHLISTEERMEQVRQAAATESQAPGSYRPGSRTSANMEDIDYAAAHRRPGPPTPTRGPPPPQQQQQQQQQRQPQPHQQQQQRAPPQQPPPTAQKPTRAQAHQAQYRPGPPEPPVRRQGTVNGEQDAVPAGSPAKSTSSGEGTLDERSSKEGSPTKEVPESESSPTKATDKKKKKFRMPSFSKKKDKKK